MAQPLIKKVAARQILDSRGIPAIEVIVEAGSVQGVFGVPSGVSKGSSEALELRDGGSAFGGLGVSRAVDNVNNIIAKKIKGKNALDQAKIDKILITLDGTLDKRKLGANAILGVSGAVCRTAAKAKKQPLYQYIGNLHKTKQFSL